MHSYKIIITKGEGLHASLGGTRNQRHLIHKGCYTHKYTVDHLLKLIQKAS